MRMDEVQQRRFFIRTAIGVLVVVGLVVGGPWIYARFLALHASEPLALTTPTDAPTTPVPAGPIEIDGTWQVGEGSQAGYRLNQTLTGQAATVVGRTEAVTGSIVVTGGFVTEASFVVDAGSIATDKAARDAFFRRALDTTTYPQATFTLTAPMDVSALGATATPLSVTAVGTLTFHGVAQPVTATLQAQRTVDGVEIAGQIPVTLADYDLIAPDLGWLVVDPTGVVEMDLLLGPVEATG
jgi:polyisoprenoid-binding protein YceI